ncbi:hypothetical protein RND81_12G018500 [Saponaria officinalis]|uniref:AAA+ ATPase domain-containing protein n=1 Tax=Saponaria officinalis TaxID=3572 RepID=A0AAW1H254_SAPOF
MEIGLGLASSITKNVASQLSKVANNEFRNTIYVDQNLQDLAIMVKTIQSKSDKLGNEELAKAEWKSCVQHLIGILYDAEDAIDALVLAFKYHDQEVARQRFIHEQESTSTGIFRFNFMATLMLASKKLVNDIALSLKKFQMGHKIKDLLSEMENLKSNLDKISEVQSKTHSKVKSRLSPFCQLQANLTESRENDKLIIIKNYLLNRSFKGAGVSIFGMAGSGKTTLARCILRDNEIREHFKHLVWASMPGNISCSEAVIFLQDEVQPLVNVSIISLLQRTGNTLLVLDDIWDVQSSWEDSIFAQNHESKVTLLITTRDPRVAKTTKTHSYNIKRLSEAECKELIKEESPSYGSERDFIIDKLAKKCCGLPLVAKKLGQAVKSMPNDTNYFSLFKASNDLWDLKVFRDVIFSSLKFNEPGLPHDMIKCLVYLNLFPRGYKFKKDELAQIWFAEGFLPPDDDSFFIKGGDYIDEMYRRAILQVSNVGQQDKGVTYEMHEYLHGFARSMVFNTCHQVEHGNSINLSNQIRHLSICCQTISNSILDTIKESCKRLRTFLLLHESGTNISKIPESFFSELRYLRVVNLSKSPITCLPRSIKNLSHLRCLDVSNTRLQTLNEKLCDIYSLQILRLKNCSNLLSLPEGICRLVNLIFLEVDIKCRIPPGIRSLTKLQALEEYVVEKLDGKQISQLENMNHLQGSIRIKKLENVSDNLEAQRANLIEKPQLEGLELYWTRLQGSDTHAESILTGLEPNNWLQELKLMCYNGGKFPHWLGSRERNLKKIHLYDCPNIDDLSVFWQLPYLNNLFVDNLSKIEKIDRNFLGDIASSERFLKLESLEFRNMANLSSWEEMVHSDFPSLLKLMIRDCPMFNVRPSFESFPNLINAKVLISRCGNNTV